MNANEIKAKAQELTQDAEWMQALSNAETTAEAAALFAQKGVEVTAEQLDQLVEKQEQGELDEADLDNVAGGDIVIALGVGVMVTLSVLAYGSAYLGSRETSSWYNQKKKKKK